MNYTSFLERRSGAAVSVEKESGKEVSKAAKTAAAIAAAAALIVLAACTARHEQPKTSQTSIPKMLGMAATQLIFVSDRGGYHQIYEKDLNSGKITALTSGNYDSMNPQVSPDGRRLVFYSDRSGSNQVFMLNVQNPTAVTQLTYEAKGVNDYDPTFTTDGRAVLYKKSDTQGAYGDIWMMNADGSNQHAVTTDLSASSDEGWKPTSVAPGQAVITVRKHPRDFYSDNLYSLNTNSGAMEPLTGNALTNWFPSYSPAAGRLVFITKQKHGGNDVLDTMKLDGTGKKNLVSMPGDNDDPSWSSDGRWVVFINGPGKQYGVYVAPAAGGKPTLLDKSPGESEDLSPLLLPPQAANP